MNYTVLERINNTEKEGINRTFGTCVEAEKNQRGRWAESVQKQGRRREKEQNLKKKKKKKKKSVCYS